MGTIKSSENLELASYLRSQRTSTQEEVDASAAPVKARYAARQDRPAQSAH